MTDEQRMKLAQGIDWARDVFDMALKRAGTRRLDDADMLLLMGGRHRLEDFVGVLQAMGGTIIHLQEELKKAQVEVAQLKGEAGDIPKPFKDALGGDDEA